MGPVVAYMASVEEAPAALDIRMAMLGVLEV
jgi:hypothetical protein